MILSLFCFIYLSLYLSFYSSVVLSIIHSIYHSISLWFFHSVDSIVLSFIWSVALIYYFIYLLFYHCITHLSFCHSINFFRHFRVNPSIHHSIYLSCLLFLPLFLFVLSNLFYLSCCLSFCHSIISTSILCIIPSIGLATVLFFIWSFAQYRSMFLLLCTYNAIYSELYLHRGGISATTSGD